MLSAVLSVGSVTEAVEVSAGAMQCSNHECSRLRVCPAAQLEA